MCALMQAPSPVGSRLFEAFSHHVIHKLNIRQSGPLVSECIASCDLYNRIFSILMSVIVITLYLIDFLVWYFGCFSQERQIRVTLLIRNTKSRIIINQNQVSGILFYLVTVLFEILIIDFNRYMLNDSGFE